MKVSATLKILMGVVLLISGSAANFAQDKNTGAIKGKVRVEKGSAAGVAVILMQNDREVARTTTNKSGDFALSHVAPGTYSVKFRKSGFSVGTIADVAVKAGQTRSLGDHLFLTIDEGSLAFVRGSVFNEARSEERRVGKGGRTEGRRR